MADITITIPDASVPRVQDAFTRALGRVATVADVKAYIINDLKQLVRNNEHQAVIEATPVPDEIDFT